jgi:hypothetical protein
LGGLVLARQTPGGKKELKTPFHYHRFRYKIKA